MARFPRRGKGSDKSNEGKISNSVSSSDRNPGRADEAFIPPAPKPPQPPKAGRTDLNAAQAFQRQQQMYSSTTPKMSRRQQAKLDAMKSPAPQSPSAALGMGMGMGGSSSSTPEFEQREFVRLTRQEIDKLAMNSVRDEYAGRKAADLTHIHKDDFRAIEDAVPFAQDRFDRWQAEWQGLAQEFALSDMTRMTAEGEQGSKITSYDMTYHKDGKWLVGIHASGDPEKETWHDFSGVFDAVAEKPESKEEMSATFLSGGSRHAVFFGKGDGRIQFSDSLPWRVEAVKDLEEFRGVLAVNDEKAVGDRLYVSVLTPYERALEQVEQREPQEGERHERVFKEITGREYSSLSNPAVERPFEVTATDMKVIDNGFDQAPALGGQVAGEPVLDALPREGRASTAEGLKEQYQWHANKMFEEGRDLKDIREATGLKPEGAEQTAWEKTDYVYGQPTALDRLKDLGAGAFAASASGYTYAMSADGKELLRFDVDGNPAGQKPVEDVQAFLHDQRGVEFDQRQEAKEMHAAELVEQKPEDQPVAELKGASLQNDDTAEVKEEMELLGSDEREGKSVENGEHNLLSQNNEIYPEHFGMHFVSGPIRERMDELKHEFDAKSMTTEQWGEAYASSRQDLQQWDGENIEQYLDLHARTELSAVKADIDLGVRLQDREDDVYAMSPDAKDELENLGVDLENLERAVQWRNAEVREAMEENQFVEKDDVARSQFLSEEAEDRRQFDQQQEPAKELTAEEGRDLVDEDRSIDEEEMIVEAETEEVAESIDKGEAISPDMEQPEKASVAQPQLTSEIGANVEIEAKSDLSSEIEDDLIAEFDAGKADYIAKYPDQEIGNELSTEKAVEDDIVVEFDRGKAHYEAEHPEMAEGKVREVSATEPSQKASAEPEEDLVAEFENAKELKDAKEAEAPEQAVEQEEEEDYRRSAGMGF